MGLLYKGDLNEPSVHFFIGLCLRQALDVLVNTGPIFWHTLQILQLMGSRTSNRPVLLPPPPPQHLPRSVLGAAQIKWIAFEGNTAHTLKRTDSHPPKITSHPLTWQWLFWVALLTNFLMSGQEAKYLPYLSRRASKNSFIIRSPWRAYQNFTMVNILEKASRLLAPGTHRQVPSQDQWWWQIECWNKTKTTMDSTLLKSHLELPKRRRKWGAGSSLKLSSLHSTGARNCLCAVCSLSTTVTSSLLWPCILIDSQ